MKKQFTAAAAMVMVLGMCATASAAFDEHLDNYTLDAVIVEADAAKNKFGDTITEQSYYRTGGDVKVITRDEIEKRHYTDLTEAIKRIPGVTFQNPGYRGGEYGYQFYNNGVSINGDTRVIILVDGRRVDNSASERVGYKSSSGTKSTGANLDQVTNMENVEKIEVIKGPGASVYGADATGGVINIITRKGGLDNVGSIDVSTGSWHKHNYALSYSGSAGSDNSWHYFVSANRNMSGDTEYKDGVTGGTGTLYGSKWKEDGVNFRLDKEFNEKQNLKIAYNFKQGKDGYPITVPSLKYWNEKDWRRIILTAAVGKLDQNNAFLEGVRGNDRFNPGYHNLFALDGMYGSFSEFNNNDWDITYTFNKENGMESFIRLYSQNHMYAHNDQYVWGVDDNGNPIKTKAIRELYKNTFPNGCTDVELNKWIDSHLAPFVGDKDKIREWIAKTGGAAIEPDTWTKEENRGVQLQVAKTVGVNDIIASVTYDKSKMDQVDMSSSSVRRAHSERSSILGYIQDKIHVSDKWDITPSIRYSRYSAFDNGNSQGKGENDLITPSINTQYMFDDTSSMYFGWTKVYRPIKKGDYDTINGVFKTPLEDEEGNAYTMGVRKDFSDKTSLAVHYDLTKMDSAIARLPIYDEASDRFTSTAVNAKEDKKSINVTMDHQFDDHLSLSASYSHMKDEWKAKDGWILDPNWGYQGGHDINVSINRLRPQNHYSLNLSYENGKLYTGLLTNWYTGCNTEAFSSKRFLVLDWNMNYEVTDDMTAYVMVSNLTDEAYETSFNSNYGIGSSAMPGRCFMVGMKYKF